MKTFTFVRGRRDVTEQQIVGLLESGYDALANIAYVMSVISDYQQELTRLIGTMPEDYEPTR